MSLQFSSKTSLKRGVRMYQLLVVGSTKEAKQIVKIFSSLPNIDLSVVIGDKEEKSFEQLLMTNDIPHEKSIQYFVEQPFDVVILTDEQYCEEEVRQSFLSNPLVVPKPLVDLLLPFLREQYFELDNLRLIFNTIRDGLIVVDRHGILRLMNDRAKKLIGVSKDVIGHHINDVIPHSRLPAVLQSKKKEENKTFILQNNQEIVTTRIPLITKGGQLIGAFATFKARDEILRLAEENTDLKKIKTMLEAIIYSSEEAISVVDEKGKGLMINPAYTRITGLSEKDVIGKPATVDIAEGESIHMQVLRTKKPIRGARLKVGPMNKDVFVNVAPVIVQNEVKGSVAVIHDLSRIESLTDALNRAKQKIRQLEATYTFDDIIGNSEEIKLAINQAKMAAETPATVLLRGASGTGKELFAHAIHNASDRSHHKFIRVNCAALAESVLESELFGYEGGAFTGARPEGKKGLFEVANKGSIFLDEIGELSLRTQAKLLRVLQEKEVVRVGGTTPIPIDVRIIAATNANLEEKINDNSFREDLYYRLNRLPIYIPSLNERLEDLPSLVTFIISKLNQLYGRTVESISDTALDKLRTHDWPGNVRELENIISRAMIYMDIKERTIEKKHINFLTEKNNVEEVKGKLTSIESAEIPLREALDQYEKQFIKEVYRANNYNKQQTAAQLQISVRTLYYKLEKYKLE